MTSEVWVGQSFIEIYLDSMGCFFLVKDLPAEMTILMSTTNPLNDKVR